MKKKINTLLDLKPLTYKKLSEELNGIIIRILQNCDNKTVKLILDLKCEVSVITYEEVKKYLNEKNNLLKTDNV